MDDKRQEQTGKGEGNKHEDGSNAFDAYQAALRQQDEWLERMQKAKAKKEAQKQK